MIVLMVVLGVICLVMTVFCIIIGIVEVVKEKDIDAYILIPIFLGAFLTVLCGATVINTNNENIKLENVVAELNNDAEVVDIELNNNKIVVHIINRENKLKTYAFKTQEHVSCNTNLLAEVVIVPKGQAPKISAVLNKGFYYSVNAVIETPYPPNVKAEKTDE